MTGRAYLSSLALLVLKTDNLSLSFLPLRVKSPLVAELTQLFNDLELSEVRVHRPSKFVFLCGGLIPPNNQGRAQNLRDYLYRIRGLSRRYNIVLAEIATQLYRDGRYTDLISFEEDIARIASVVLVIAESAGSLTELGAFTANDTIQKSLRVVIREHFERSESFIRYGPIERLKRIRRANLAVYPWQTHANGMLNVKSTRPHYREIIKFFHDHFSAVPASTNFERLGEAKLFYVIYWIIHLCLAVSETALNEYVRQIIPEATDDEIWRKLYCMKLAGWIAQLAYHTNEYFWALHNEDPFEYEFKAGVTDRTSSLRRRIVVTAALRKAEKLPQHVVKEASKPRAVGAP